MNHILNLYKAIGVGISLICLILVGAVVMLSNSDPIVVLQDETSRSFVKGSRVALEITENDVREFIRSWIELRYEWDKPSADLILGNITPFTSENLLKKLKALLNHQKDDRLKGKKLSQYVPKREHIEVKVTDKNIYANFDTVLRIDGVPLVTPAQVSFSVMQGSRTYANPLGLYVNKIMEHRVK